MRSVFVKCLLTVYVPEEEVFHVVVDVQQLSHQLVIINLRSHWSECVQSFVYHIELLCRTMHLDIFTGQSHTFGQLDSDLSLEYICSPYGWTLYDITNKYILGWT